MEAEDSGGTRSGGVCPVALRPQMPAGQWPGSTAGFHCRVHTVSGEHLCSEEGPTLQTPHTVACRWITSSAARPSVPAPHVGVAGPGGPGEPVLLV